MLAAHPRSSEAVLDAFAASQLSSFNSRTARNFSCIEALYESQSEGPIGPKGPLGGLGLIVALSFGRLGNGLGSRCFMRERFLRPFIPGSGRSRAGATMGERERAFCSKGRHLAKCTTPSSGSLTVSPAAVSMSPIMHG
jgi:hypothetical protein